MDSGKLATTLNKTWTTVRLSDVYWFQEGPGVRAWQFTSSGVKLLNVANITSQGELDLSASERYLSNEEVETRYRHFLVDLGDLVIASSGISFDKDGHLRTRGAFVEEQHLPLCMNTSTIRFKARDNLSDLLFLKYWLDSDEFRSQISRLVTGSAQQNFGPSHLEQILVSLPPLDEQRRIAAILRAADDERRRRRYTQSLSDSMLRETFVQMFGDPETNPMEWERVTVDAVLSTTRKGTQTGPFGSSLKRHEYVDVGIPVWGIDNVTEYGFKEEGSLFITPEKYRELRNYSVENGDILISRAGTVGRMCVASPKQSPSIIGTNLVRVSLDKTKMLPMYFVSLFMSFTRQAGQLRASGDEGAYSFMNPETLRATRVMHPPLNLQSQFAAFVADHEQTRYQQQESARQTEHLFQTLLHRAFREEL